MPKTRSKQKRRSKIPKLIPLAYSNGRDVYCELCKNTIKVGNPVGWWQVPGRGGRMRTTAYCAECHHGNVRAGEPLQAKDAEWSR